jgi:hypothetical protein
MAAGGFRLVGQLHELRQGDPRPGRAVPADELSRRYFERMHLGQHKPPPAFHGDAAWVVGYGPAAVGPNDVHLLGTEPPLKAARYPEPPTGPGSPVGHG